MVMMIVHFLLSLSCYYCDYDRCFLSVGFIISLVYCLIILVGYSLFGIAHAQFNYQD